MPDIDGDSFVFIITKPQKPKTLIHLPRELDDVNEPNNTKEATFFWQFQGAFGDVFKDFIIGR